MKLNVAAVITEPGSTENNKTGSWRTAKPVWDRDKCTQCMICWQFCPDACILIKKGKRAETDFDYCKGCGICAEVCPIKCIQMMREEK